MAEKKRSVRKSQKLGEPIHRDPEGGEGGSGVGFSEESGFVEKLKKLWLKLKDKWFFWLFVGAVLLQIILSV